MTMDEYSISYPMRAPLLESTAVVVEDRSGCGTSPSNQPMEPEEQVVNSKLRYSRAEGTSDHNFKPSSLEHSSSLTESVKLKSKENNEGEDSDSFFDDETHSVTEHVLPSMATEHLCKRNSTSCRSVSTNLSKKVTDSADSATCGVIKCKVEQGLDKLFSGVGDNPTEQDSLDPGASPRPKIKDESENCGTGQASLSGFDSTQKPQHKTNTSTPNVLHKVHKNKTVDSTNTFSISSLERSGASASSVTMDGSGRRLQANGPPIKTAILRFRLDPSTNKFKEVVPAVANIRVNDSSCSTLPDRSVAKASSEQTMSPWDMWLLKKVQQDLERQRLLKSETLKSKSEEEKIREMKSEKLNQAAIVHEEWVRKKNAEERARRRARKENIKIQEEASHQKRQMSQAKANASFTDWKKRKEEAEDRLKEEMKERAKLQEQEQRELRERADHAYKVWLRTVGCRKIDKELLCPKTQRDFMFSSANTNRLRKWHFY